MNAQRRHFVIVGASLAGARAAEALRKEGFEGRITLIGEEAERPYERPPLSKGLLTGKAAPDDAYVHPEGFYEENEIELHRSRRAVAVDRRGRAVELADGERLAYDALLLTTGAAPRRLNIKGGDLEGVHYLRTMADSIALREALQAAGRAVVIGAGWIGCEVAASARDLGAEVAMVDMAAQPLERVLGPEVGGFFRDLHASHGVALHLGGGVDELTGTGSVRSVRLSDGTELDAPMVVVGVGAAPRIELAESAGLSRSDGVDTDEFLATDGPGIFAAGDVAGAWHPVLKRRIRLEHWSSALNQGPLAARNMLGRATPYEKLPYFFSDQYDVGLEYTGLATDWDRVVYRGKPDEREFIAFWLKDDRVKAGMNVNVWDVADDIGALVRSGSPVTVDRLTDPEVPLGEVLDG